MSNIDEFFATARERHAIYIRRMVQKKPGPWTYDGIFQAHRFCNVFRELDTTTIWFKDHVREPMRARPEVMLATVVFRLFNRIETGEAVFCQEHINSDGNGIPQTAFEWLLERGTTDMMRGSIKAYLGNGPYCTGSYIVNSPGGMDKLTGVLWMIEQFAKSNWRDIASQLLTENTNTSGPGFGLAPLKIEGTLYRYENEIGPFTLADIWMWFLKYPGIGPFVAYELVSDLRHTDLLCNAPDIMTWANPGPGAKRGLKLVMQNENLPQGSMLEHMKTLLTMSQSGKYWPPRYPQWEMREVEHWLCEYAKYKRIQGGGPGTRRKFQGGNL